MSNGNYQRFIPAFKRIVRWDERHKREHHGRPKPPSQVWKDVVAEDSDEDGDESEP